MNEEEARIKEEEVASEAVVDDKEWWSKRMSTLIVLIALIEPDIFKWGMVQREGTEFYFITGQHKVNYQDQGRGDVTINSWK